MNHSVNEDEVEMSCNHFGKLQFVVPKLHSEKFLINHIFVISFNGILIIPTVLLNAIAIITIFKSSQLKSKPCYFIILVQSVIDLLVGVLGIPLFIVYLSSAVGGNKNCFAASFAFRSTALPIGMSTITLAAMTLERYIAILHPYSYNTKITKKRLLICVGSGVLFAISLIILAFINIILFAFCAAALEMLIFIFTAYSSIKIYSVVKNLSRSPNKPHDVNAEANITRKKVIIQEMKHAKSCFLAVICFGLLCFLPIAIAVSFHNKVDILKWEAIKVWVVTLGLLNSSVNSVIFFWTKKMLRNEAYKTLNTKLCFISQTETNSAPE